jgi:hypothetical protein
MTQDIEFLEDKVFAALKKDIVQQIQRGQIEPLSDRVTHLEKMGNKGMMDEATSDFSKKEDNEQYDTH